ncbi:coil containing protein [Vibrio phage 1.193.O._10N.286.52.C6]|nr:coil containing protein [Vibrio phage 1.193.O._10N.286.52.C6]
MNLLIGLSKMSDNIDELVSRVEKLQKVQASVGVTREDGIHEPSGMTYVDLHWLHHAGSSKNNLPARPISSIALMSFNGEPLIKKSLDKYFSNLNKRNGGGSAGDVFKPYLKGLLDYTQNYVFGSVSKLAPNSPYTVKMKGKNSPLQDTNQLASQWKVRINGKVIK